MVRPIPLTHVVDHLHNFSSSPVPLAIGLFVSVSLLLGLCAKHAWQIGKKMAASESGEEPNTGKTAAAFGSPRRLMATISHKAMIPVLHAKKTWKELEVNLHMNENKNKDGKDGELGDAYGETSAGVWRKAILMGEKCQPLEFSGVIFYDYEGNRVSEMPKSPCRASPLRNFNSFPSLV